MTNLVLTRENSIAELKANVVKATPDGLALQVAKLFAGMSHKATTGDNAAMTVAVYVSALAGQPLFAAERAVQAFLQGRVAGASAKFAPSTAELVLECDRQFNMAVSLHPSMQMPKEIEPPRKSKLNPVNTARANEILARFKASMPVDEEWKKPPPRSAAFSAVLEKIKAAIADRGDPPAFQDHDERFGTKN